MIELGMRRFADKTRSPILPENLLNLSGSGRATLLAETMADAVIIFWSTSWSEPGEVCRKPLDAGNTGPVLVEKLWGGLCPAVQVLWLR